MTTKQKVIDMGNGLVEQEPAKKPEPSALQVAIERGADPQVLLQMMELQERYDRNRAAEAFGEAITKFQSLCPIVHKGRSTKDSGAFGYTFASYDDIVRAASPALKECGLAVSFSTEHVEHGIKVTCRIRHGIHAEDCTLTVPVPNTLKVSDTQKYGAALSYAKRYALCAALNIVVSDEDSDAAGMHEVISESDFRALEQLLMESNSDFGRFCKAYGIDKVADLPASQLAQARSQIIRKMDKESGR
jgi:hypothetical protein